MRQERSSHGGTTSSVIEFEPTPNPDAVKVRPGRLLAKGAPREFDGPPADASDPFAAMLLGIDGIVRVMIGRDWLTVVREGPQFAWDQMRSEIALALTDAAYQAERGHVGNSASGRPCSPTAEFSEIELEIDHVLERWVRPLLEADGGQAVLERFDEEEGVAWVRMEGACGGCPSSSITLNRSIEQAVRKWVPEVKRVRSVQGEASPTGDPKARFRAWVARKWGGD